MSFALLLIGLGLLQGIRHALEPDHVAAVSTLGAQTRSGKALVKFAAAWSAGHGTVLLFVSGALVLLGRAMPAAWSTALEGGVACMLIALGLRALWIARGLGLAGERQPHDHGPEAHVHPTKVPHVHVGPETFATLPFVVGLVHGLAGSGALAAIAAPRAHSAWGAVGFVFAYAVGAMLGMVALAALLAGPLGTISSARVRAGVVALSGMLSVGVGLYWGSLLM